MATHYCPLCNQPRLVLSEVGADASYTFVFVWASNLSNPRNAHQHSFQLRIIDARSFWRTETYVEHGVLQSEGVTYIRC
jgi:hypothetical protein